MAKTGVSLDLLVNLQQHFTSLTQSKNFHSLKAVQNSLLVKENQTMPTSLVQKKDNQSTIYADSAFAINQHNINSFMTKVDIAHNDKNNNESTENKASLIDVESDIEQSPFKKININYCENKKQNLNNQTSMIPSLDAAMSNSFPSSASTHSANGNQCNLIINKYPESDKPKRRSRLGGTSVKTAEVWRFFTQIPPPEQAATCSLCQKIIKATNSSTTGMIRHLRSCHSVEYQILQEARRSNLILKTLKNAAPSEALQILQGFGIGTSSHDINMSVESLTSATTPLSILNSVNKVNTIKDKNQNLHGLATIPSIPLLAASSNTSQKYRKHHTVESIIGNVNKSNINAKTLNNFANSSTISNQYLENMINMFKNPQQAMSISPPNIVTERKILSANKTNGLTSIKNSTHSDNQHFKFYEKETLRVNQLLHDKTVLNEKNSELNLQKNKNNLSLSNLYAPDFANHDEQSSEPSYLKNGDEKNSFSDEPPEKKIRFENFCEMAANNISSSDDSLNFLSDITTNHINDIEKKLSSETASKFSESPISNKKLLMSENQERDFFATSCEKGPICASTPRTYNFDEIRYLNEAKKLDKQIALMILVDKNDSELLVDRQGFRGFIKAFFPKYQLPTSKKFRNEIIPQLISQLQGDFSSLQSQLDFNNPFGLSNSPNNLKCGLEKTTEESLHQPCLSATIARHSGISPSTTIESGFQDYDDVENQSPKSLKIDVCSNNNENDCGNNNSDEISVDDTNTKNNEKFKELVQNSIRSAQNISQSFFYSIKVDTENNSNKFNELASRLSFVKNEEIEKDVTSDDHHSSKTNLSTSCSLSICSSSEDVDGNNNKDKNH